MIQPTDTVTSATAIGDTADTVTSATAIGDTAN